MSILLKNNFERIKHHKAVLLIACIIMPLLICAAVFISNHSTTQEVIAVSGGTVSNTMLYGAGILGRSASGAL